MKKFVAALMCLMMFLFLSSCDLDNTNDTNTNTNSDISSGDTAKTQAEIAMETYEAAINGEICVIDESLCEIKLKDCRFPSNNLKLGESEILYKAILDMDGDGINEYIIQSEAKDHIVLHYHDGKVYSYCFVGKDFFNLNTDGSFYWIDSYEADNCTRGCNQIAFDRSSSRVKEIYRIKQTSPYDYGDNDHEYYVNGNRIEREDFLDYYDSNCRGKTRATFSPLDISREYPISSEKAFEFASNYWGFKSGTEDGAAGTLYVLKIIILEKPNNDTQSYRIACQAEGYTSHVIDSCYAQPPMSVRIYKELFVDAITGECREYITQDNDSYHRLSYEDAYEIALKHWRIRPDDPDGACGTTIYCKAIIVEVPSKENVYYHILKIFEYYHHTVEGWKNDPPYNVSLDKELLIDSTTGECIDVDTEIYCKISPQNALNKASEYLGVRRLDIDIDGETMVVSKLVVSDFAHCNKQYYRVVLKTDYYIYNEDTTENNVLYNSEIIKEIFVNSVTGECMESRPNDR